MNTSASVRAEYLRASRLSFHNGRISQMSPWPNFTPVDWPSYREKCEEERATVDPIYDPRVLEDTPFGRFNDVTELSPRDRIKRMFTTFPYRDASWLTAIIFVLGSVDFIINAFFGLLPLVAPDTAFETEAIIAVPATIFIGAFMFLSAGILDLFGAFNADRGIIEISKDSDEKNTPSNHRPALLGGTNWVWIPPSGRFTELLLNSRPFQAGLVQLFGGIILTISAVTGVPGLLDPMDPNFPLLVFGPQVIGGLMFLIANIYLAFSEQNYWWQPKPFDAKW